MKKIVIAITLLALVLAISLTVYKGHEYSKLNTKDIKGKIKSTISETDNIKKKIETKEKEKEQIKSENEEKVKVLEVWEGMLKEIKENI